MSKKTREDGTDALYIETDKGVIRLTKPPKDRPRKKAPVLVDGGIRDVTPKQAKTGASQ